jgi:glycosyltransferase involved in cell wall biosynthesis
VAGRPSFSFLIETANLAAAELADLRACLDSLERQDPSPTEAVDALLLVAGDVSPETAEELGRDYPWLRIHRLDDGIDYTSMKVHGATLTDADVIVLCDSDCRYQGGWLANLLAPFADPEVQVVGGETSTPVRGPYSLALAITFIFPRFSGGARLTRGTVYWANNAAIRRELLLREPLPIGLPLFRGQNIVHSRRLSELGHTIWREPRARALHVIPSVRELPLRYFRLGRDAVNIARFARTTAGRPYCGAVPPDRCGDGPLRKLVRRAAQAVGESPARTVLLPLAAPVVLVAGLCYEAGRLAARPTP